MSSIVRSDLILFRSHSRQDRSSSRCRFCFKTSTRLRSSCCFSAEPSAVGVPFDAVAPAALTLVSADVPISQSAFSGQSAAVVMNWTHMGANSLGRCSFLSTKAICRRSHRSKRPVGFLSRSFLGRCLFLSCLAICRRSQRSKLLIAVCLFLYLLSSFAMCSRSHHCKLALRKRGSGLIARTNLLQNSCAINSCNFPGFNYCKLKSSPSIFQMDWTVPPVHTLTPHVIEILAKRLEDTAHLSQEFQAPNRWRHQGRSNETTNMLKHHKANFEVCQVPPMLCGTKCQSCLQTFHKSPCTFLIPHLLFH